jgi:aspartate-semialdehyde dehydrogenase
LFAVAIVGATGLVGRTCLEVLAARRFPIARLGLYASSRSAGRRLRFDGSEHRVLDLATADPSGYDLALFAAGAEVSRQAAPAFAAAGALVVDNSSAFRLAPDVPLIVPEVNGAALTAVSADGATGRGRIIANPNCSTIQLVVALKPLHDAARLKRVTAATYQSASGAGQKGLDELERETARALAGAPPAARVFAHPLAFGALPQIGAFLDGGATVEEQKMVDETRKILGLPTLAISTTCVRVPVRVGHSEAVWIETERALAPEDARILLAAAPGVRVVDDPAAGAYPLAGTAAGTDLVHVGRIRRDPASAHGLILWIVADNVRKGAATNAVQIAELALAAGAATPEAAKDGAAGSR